MSNYAATLQDPFRPSINPQFYELKEASSIREILLMQGVIDDKGNRVQPFVVAVNGDYKLEKDWDSLVCPSDLMVTVPIPPYLQGGGGSNPMRMVMMVAVAVAAAYTGGAAAAWAGAAGYGAGATAAIGALASAGVMVAGGMLMNALLPAPQVAAGNGYNGQPKENYLIGPQANQAKPGEPIATLYGRRRIYPDLAAQPYVEFSGNEAYLHSLYIITQGEIDIESYFIEKTPFSNFEEVEYKKYEPFEKMDMFPDNVYTAQEVSDFKLEGAGSGDPHVIGYKSAVTYRKITDSNGRHPSDEKWMPTYEKTTTYAEVTSNVQFKGGFIATPLGAETETIGIDVTLPRGLAFMDDNGFPIWNRVSFIAQARLIDDSNQPVGSWFNLTKEATELPSGSVEIVHSIEGGSQGTEIGNPDLILGRGEEVLNAGIWIQGATIDPILQSYTFSVPKGRYEVRVARGNASSGLTRVSDEIHWSGLRSYMPNKHYYGNVTLLAVKIRATNNLNNNIARRVNVIGTRIIPVWNGEEWIKQPTRSIAWAAADVLRNKEYGRGLKDSRLNLKELMRLDRIWYSRNDFFDGYFTDQMTTWDALTRVLEVGRTKPIYVAGVIDFVRNEPRIAPTQMFTPENIVQDSFRTNWVFPKTGDPDHVIIEYTDPVSWQPADMVCALPECEFIKPIRIAMHAITSPQQAWREGIHRVAMHFEQREFMNWSTELEGLSVSYGNEVLLSYDRPEWGSSGRVEHFDGNIVYTSNDLEWTGNNVITFRAKSGRPLGSYRIERISENSGRIPDLPLNDNGQPSLSNGRSYEATHYIFGNTERVGVHVVITSASPSSNNLVGLSGVTYSDYPHEVENELEMPVVVPPHDPIEEVLAVTWIKVKKSIERNVFEVSCNQARGAKEYEFEVRSSVSDAWELLQKSETPLYTGKLPFGNQINIRARVIGSHAGEWFYWSGEVLEEDIPIKKTRPGLRVDKRGNFPVYADITITGIDLGSATNYFIEQDGIVIWTGVLLKGQEATITRQFEPDVVIDQEEVPEPKQVEFKAYAIDGHGDRSESAINHMVY